MAETKLLERGKARHPQSVLCSELVLETLHVGEPGIDELATT
jgi:hypothetical protein